MKTKTIELYEFDELSESAQAKVLETERDINVDFAWSKWTLEDWEEQLKAMGFEDPQINFSGFWSQGDGASFTSKRVDILKFLTVHKAKGRFKAILKALKKDEIDASVERIDHSYSHEYTVRANIEFMTDDTDLKAQESYDFSVLLTETVRTLSRKIYKDLESEYEGLTSDEAVIDTIKANEYTFRSNGKMENA